MRRIFLSLSSAILLLCAGLLPAQSPASRTAQTIIADVLAQMPANTQEDYNRQMSDLASTGETGVLALVQRFNPPGKGSNALVEYALSGLAHYASLNGENGDSLTIVNAFKKALAATTDKEIKAFLEEQLRVMGEGDPAVFPAQPITVKVTKNSPVHLRIAELQKKFIKIMSNKKGLSSLDDEYDWISMSVGSAFMLLPIERDQEEIYAHRRKMLAANVITALKDPSIEYRNAALDFVSPFGYREIYSALLKALPKMKPEVKTDVLNWLGREAQCPQKQSVLITVETRIEVPAVQTVIKELNNADFDVKQAAAWALARIGQPQAIPSLAALLASDDPKAVELGQSTLASFKGKISPEVVRVIDVASDKGKIAAIELLALRKAGNYLNEVLNLTKTGSPEVKTAAYNALKDVVGEKDLTNICGMLESTDKAYIAPLQQAVIAALSSQPTAQRVETLVRRMYQADNSKKHLYYLPLASTGDDKALPLIMDGFAKDKGEAKDAAFEALLNWKGFGVADALYDICQAPAAASYFDRALTAYVKRVSNPSLTGDNRLIYLRNAMETAKTDAQKNAILAQIGQTGTFLGLLYAGEFLDNGALKENAAQAVMKIALDHPEYTGENVVALLAKASVALSNPDADYQRQSIKKHLSEMPKNKGFVSIFNGKDLAGWKGLLAGPNDNPLKRAQLKPKELAKAQALADEDMRKSWVVENGILTFLGHGHSLATDKPYGDIEMYVDWKLDPAGPEADAGIYLRGTPQVQIWDTARVNVGAQVGSGGLYNNQSNPSKPLKVADNRLGEWNTFYIKMTGDRVTVKLNGELVTDNVILENYWDRKLPIFPTEQIELQAHGSKVYYRNIYVKELERPELFQLSSEEKKEGYKILFDGANMHEWTGNLTDYQLEDGCISVNPTSSFGGNLYTKQEYANFVFRFEFQLTPAANNGVGIRAPMDGDNAYNAMEIQILDCEHPVYKDIEPYQHHGSVYGVIAAEHGAMKPAGEWNVEEIYADGDHIRVTLNGKVILDGNIREATKNGARDHKEHPGLFNKSGHIGFLGHGSPLKFKNIRIKTLK